MRRRLSQKVLVTAALAGALTTTIAAPPASAGEQGPGCEHMLDQETCDEHYYPTIYFVGDHLTTVFQTADHVVETAFDVAIWAGNTYDCEVHGRCD